MYSQAPTGSRPEEFRTFEDLQVYRSAREFRTAMYAVTRQLPTFEKFELASQIRRASVSLTNNIAEGHGRYHFADQIKFQLQARGSLTELIDDLNICSDENYLPADRVIVLKEQAVAVHQLINGYIRYLRERKAGSNLTLHDAPGADPISDEELDALLSETL
ncbi:MAG TPA: four helix bundle protein [Verrucomicrobiae bacterium]|nr:four helix bundle protein [Verrucomicrobiae bacterium]